MTRNPHDPPTQHRAAEGFGKFVALGLLEEADVLPLLVEAAIEAGYTGDLGGLRARLAWTLHAAMDSATQAAMRAEVSVAKVIRPLFARWARPSAIADAAFRENAERGDPLLARDVRKVIELEAADFMARTAGARRYAR